MLRIHQVYALQDKLQEILTDAIVSEMNVLTQYRACGILDKCNALQQRITYLSNLQFALQGYGIMCLNEVDIQKIATIIGVSVNCIYADLPKEPLLLPGCTDPMALNYNPDAAPGGQCFYCNADAIQFSVNFVNTRQCKVNDILITTENI